MVHTSSLKKLLKVYIFETSKKLLALIKTLLNDFILFHSIILSTGVQN